jgi:hypothetical protein
MTNVAVSIVPQERSGMASGINGTMRQVGVALGFAGLGAILAHRTAQVFFIKVGNLGLPPDQINSLSARVIKGDIAGATTAVDIPLQSAFRVAADASLFEGFHLIVLVGGLVGLTGALITYVLMRPSSKTL